MKATILHKIILLTAVLFVSIGAHSQVKVGLEAGVSIKKLSFSKDVYKSDNATGFFLGPKMKATLPVLGLGVDAGLLYAQNKTEIVEGVKKHMNYIRVPVNLRWEIGPKEVGVYVATGPQWDWYIGNSKLYTKEGLHAVFEHNIVSWNIGAGLMLLRHLQLGASYAIPISKSGSVRDYYDQVSDNIDIKNKEWQIRLNYFF